MRAVFALLLLAGCIHPKETPSEELERCVKAYNEHLRWARFEKASVFIEAPERPHFMALYEPSEETLHIDELEIKSVDFEEKKAKVVITAKYWKAPSVTVERKRWVQQWKRVDGEWYMTTPPEEPFFKAPVSPPSS